MKKNVIGFHYNLKDKENNMIDSSKDSTPLFILEGSGEIIPGLEKELVKMDKGEKKSIEVPHQEAYGDVIEDLKISVKRTQFPEDAVLNVGDQFQVNEDPSAPLFTVVKVEDDDIHLDGNHPMAGRDLHFEVEIVEKREATEEEVSHGHAHGPGAHEH